MKTKIFADQNYVPNGSRHEPMLYPFWGQILNGDDHLIWDNVFTKYMETANLFFEMTSFEESDLVVVPCNWKTLINYPEQIIRINEFIESAQRAGKISMSFFEGDVSHLNLPTETDLIFRDSLYASTRKRNDFAMPAFCRDFVKLYLNNEVPIRQKSNKPTVGFCGFVNSKEIKTYLRLVFYQFNKMLNSKKQENPPFYIGHILRSKGLSTLSKSSLIKTNFIERQKSVFFSISDPILQKKLTQEFVQNMVESDYIFCCRGYGNYSYRLYEALCCGKIPVFIDTDCVLPFDFHIDWKKYCVWIKEDELSFIADILAEFHSKISPSDFIDLQYECRRIWQDYLSPEGFFSNLHQHISLVSKLS